MSSYNDCEPDYFFDVQTRQRPATPQQAAAAQQQSAEERQRDLLMERRRQEQVLYLTLLAQNGPVTEVTAPITGDFIENDYKPIYTNNTNNPVRIQVFADLVNPGCGAFLSLTRDLSDVGKFDALTLTANGRTESVQTIILPTYSVWARDFNAAFFPMQGNDVLRVRVFDPAKLINYGNLYPELTRKY